MLSINKQVNGAARKRKINELARSIRKKYLSFKIGNTDTEENLEKFFKPMVKPLKEIASTSNILNKKISTSTWPVKMEFKKESKKEESEKEKPTLFLDDNIIGEISGTSSAHQDDDEYFEDPFNISADAFEDYIEQYHPMTQPYVLDFFKKSDKIDNVYGPIYDLSSSKWMLGNKFIDFDKKNARISVGDVQFKGTPGLYQLLFYKDPHHNEEDRKAYFNLLDLTNVHRTSNNRLKHSRLLKYQEVIQPHFQTYRSRAKTTGSGLTYNEKPIEYVYWDNINELVERLKLLIASKEAGNTSHDNEITAIINELKEANVISERT